MDETHVRAYQALRTTWAEVGNQKQVPSYGHHDHVSIFDAVDVQQGDVVFHRASSANAETFLDFLRRLKEKYTDRFLVLVLGNARIHHATRWCKPFLMARKAMLFISSFCHRILHS
ncbi:transposase [Anoxybacillus flavithermus]|uniref:transposase n=1 Tax=Anoxybacillus flavithermus TaxID=33934 RepID=UPI0030B9AAF0